MKVKTMLFPILVAVGLFLSAAAAPPARAGVIEPSGDTTGETDADAIETALRNCPPGGTVTLDGGTFYVSREIVVPDFSGTLEGQGMDPPNATTIRAVRDRGQPFDGSYLTSWSSKDAPSILLFEHPYGGDVYDLTVRNMTLEVLDPSPESPNYSNSGSALTNLLAVWGGNCNTTLEGVRFRGAPSTAPGNAGGKNVAVGAHIMLGRVPLLDTSNYGTGDVSVTDCEVENVKYGIVVMAIRNSTIKEHDNVGRSCVWTYANSFTDNSVETLSFNDALDCGGDGFDLANFTGGQLTVKHNTVAMNRSVAQTFGASTGIWLASVAHADIWGNVITGGATNLGIISVMRFFSFSVSHDITIHNNTLIGNGDPYGIYLYRPSEGITIKDNVLKSLDDAFAGIYVRSNDNTISSNDFSASGLPGWSLEDGVLQGAGCVELDGTTAGNQVNESPASTSSSLFPPGTNLCTQVADLTDDPTTADYDGANDITDIQTCADSN